MGRRARRLESWPVRSQRKSRLQAAHHHRQRKRRRLGLFWGHRDGVLANASVPYLGDLEIICVPRGSIWSITLSDAPFVRTLSPHMIFGGNYTPVHSPAGPKVIDQHRGAKETARRAKAMLDATRAPV